MGKPTRQVRSARFGLRWSLFTGPFDQPPILGLASPLFPGILPSRNLLKPPKKKKRGSQQWENHFFRVMTCHDQLTHSWGCKKVLVRSFAHGLARANHKNAPRGRPARRGLHRGGGAPEVQGHMLRVEEQGSQEPVLAAEGLQVLLRNFNMAMWLFSSGSPKMAGEKWRVPFGLKKSMAFHGSLFEWIDFQDG